VEADDKLVVKNLKGEFLAVEKTFLQALCFRKALLCLFFILNGTVSISKLFFTSIEMYKKSADLSTSLC
jgi:hypothetical protein